MHRLSPLPGLIKLPSQSALERGLHARKAKGCMSNSRVYGLASARAELPESSFADAAEVALPCRCCDALRPADHPPAEKKATLQLSVMHSNQFPPDSLHP